MKKTEVFLGIPQTIHSSTYIRPSLGLPRVSVTSLTPHTSL